MPRLISRTEATADSLETLVKDALALYEQSGNIDSPSGAFLGGASFALLVAAEIDVPWIARKSVYEAQERIAKEAMRLRAAAMTIKPYANDNQEQPSA